MITRNKASLLQEDCIKRIQDRRIKQRILIFEYARLLAENTPHKFNWAKINRTILARYKMSGLERIKEGAWKVHEQWIEAEQKRKVAYKVKW